MTIAEILNNLLLMPLQMLFEAIFKIAYSFIGNPGMTIIVFSLMINMLVLPLYRRADAMQEEERCIEKKLSKGVQHIKKTFHGDEQMMMLQTYYRQNEYKPTYVLRGASSLMLEIPFFIVAYRFLSGLSLLQGASFGLISDLGKPDGLLTVAKMSINVLPIIMTGINFISSYLFTRDYPVKTKIQLYGMAIFFLVFLYDSPSGLVFYWTLNNAFSLVKTVFYKLKQPRKVLSVLAAIIGLAAFAFGVTVGAKRSVKWAIFFCATGVLLEIPIISMIIRANNKPIEKETSKSTNNTKIFFVGACFLAILTGLVIPSSVIAASPQEFVVQGCLNNPLWYLVSSCCLSVGTFIIWFGVFYSLADQRARSYIVQLIWILCGITIVNYMFFGNDMGLLSNTLQYEKKMSFTLDQQFINFVVNLGVALVMWFAWRIIKKRTLEVIVVTTLALCGVTIVNVNTINASISKMYISNDSKSTALHSLSKNGKNVVVLMLDRGISEYIPYMMQEKPELKQQFDGFTFYANTISFASFTNMGAPCLFGGYEYTPFENNKRANESLESKHNEALKVMPLLFSSNGYDVTVCQPTYAGYQWTPDLSIFGDCPGISAYNTLGMYSDENKALIENNMRNFFAFGITKVAPLFMQIRLYDGGIYNNSTLQESVSAVTQTVDGLLHASGNSTLFLQNYSVLSSLPLITDVTDSEQDTFLMMTNDTPHEPCLLQMPDYTPSEKVDNTSYADQLKSAYTINGQTLKMETEKQVMHYHVNMAAMLQMGEWFDYLRENDVYDNTRIIIVSDHGRDVGQLDEAIFNLGDGVKVDSEFYRALLLVKDFNATGFTTSDTFMSNADTPTLAFENLIENPVNPFTGKTIDNTDKTAHDQYVLESNKWDIYENNGNVFLPGNWYAVHGDTWNADNWKLVATDSVSPETGE